MIKLTYCLRRLASLSREEFQKYWFETHGPLVRKHAKVLRIKRYVQMHSRGASINDALQTSRGGPAPYDGVAELWWDTAAELEAALSSSEGQVAGAELLEDEKKFIELGESPLWIGEERGIITPRTSGRRKKAALKRAPKRATKRPPKRGVKRASGRRER